MFTLCVCDYDSDVGRSGGTLARFQAASWLHMDDLWLITEVQSLLNSGELQEPINGHVVQAVHVEMWKMDSRAWSCNDGSTLLMQITLEVECRTSHGPPYTLHLAHKDTRLHMRTWVGWVCKFLFSFHPKLLINAPLRVHKYFMRIPRQWAEWLYMMMSRLTNHNQANARIL